jgi:eukaryotic-like serine/threonine-protein kinase
MERDPTKSLRIDTGPIRPGQVLAQKYRIIRELGRGGMGIVYEAEDLSLRRKVALKFLPPGLTADTDARERFVHEAQAASGLDHPNICTIHEIGEAEAGGLFIAMACYEGESLKEKLGRGPLSPSQAVQIALDIAEGLAKAHEHHIVHRDIKPGNVMITADGTAKILDFGLAKLAGEVRLTIQGTTMGTVAYMSPEQARGDDVDERTDVWSLGIVLYEMATGELPFGLEKEQAVLHSILHEAPRPVKELNRGYPAEFFRIIEKALAKDPARRFLSAAEMAASLRELKGRMSARSLPAARRMSFGKPRRHLFLAAAALTLAAVTAAIWLLSRPGLAFESRDRLMVADADNLTGDKVFDLALRTAIEAGLQQSAYAVIFDRPQINDTLRLMRRDASTRVDETLGYDVCRFAGVRAFILPRILSAGEAYELEAILIDPLKRRHVDRVRVTARGREEVLLKGIDRLTKQLRARLGESLAAIEKSEVPVATVTTSSWEALDYFAMAQGKRNDGKFKEAVPLYELALEKDPHFVAARSSLGLVLIQFMNQAGRGKELLRTALADAQGQGLPQRDLLPLRAVHRQFVDGDLPGALEEYKTLLGLFPDLMPPANNAGRVLQAMGRSDEAAAMYEEAIKRAPRSSIALQNLWFLNMNIRKDARAGESAARRLVDLAPSLANPHSFLGYALAVQEKFTEAEKELRKALDTEPDHPYAQPNLGHVLFAAGKAAEAVPIYRSLLELTRQGKSTGNLEWDSVAFILALRLSGQKEEAAQAFAEAWAGLEKKVRGRPAEPGNCLAFAGLAAAAGDAGRAEPFIKQAQVLGLKDANDRMDLAEVYALTGRPAQALEWIKKSLGSGFTDPFFPILLPEFQSLRTLPEFRVLFKLDDK